MLGIQAKTLVHDQYRRSAEGNENLERSFKIGNLASAAIKWDHSAATSNNQFALEEYEQKKSMEKLMTIDDAR